MKERKRERALLERAIAGVREHHSTKFQHDDKEHYIYIFCIITARNELPTLNI